MSTTYLPNKHVGYPALNDTGWGSTVDTSLTNVDTALGGRQLFNLGSASGTVAVSATTYNGNYPSNVASYVPLTWLLQGTLTASVNLQIPSGVGGQWVINNVCAMGAYGITVSVSGGSAVATLENGVQTVYSDTAGNVYPVNGLLPSGALFQGGWPGAQNIPVATFTTLNFTQINSPPSFGTWSGGTLTISHAGTYLINTAATVEAFYASAVNGAMNLGIYRNGGNIASTQASIPGVASSWTYMAEVTSIIVCSATDTLTVQAYIYNSGGPFTSAATTTGVNNISIVKLF